MWNHRRWCLEHTSANAAEHGTAENMAQLRNVVSHGGDNVRSINLKKVRIFLTNLIWCNHAAIAIGMYVWAISMSWECSHEWTSASAWVGYTQGCIECGEDTHTYVLRHLHRKPERSDSEVKPHKEWLCGKCKELGYNCTKHRPTTSRLVLWILYDKKRWTRIFVCVTRKPRLQTQRKMHVCK